MDVEELARRLRAAATEANRSKAHDVAWRLAEAAELLESKPSPTAEAVARKLLEQS